MSKAGSYKETKADGNLATFALGIEFSPPNKSAIRISLRPDYLAVTDSAA